MSGTVSSLSESLTLQSVSFVLSSLNGPERVDAGGQHYKACDDGGGIPGSGGGCRFGRRAVGVRGRGSRTDLRRVRTGHRNAVLPVGLSGTGIARLYAGIWGQVAQDSSLSEVDLYLGYRNETAAGLSYDFGYARYFYPNDGGDCCGELTASLGVPVGEKLTTTFDLAYDPAASLGNAYVEVAYQATDKFGLSANYGVYEVEAAPSEREWDFGVTYGLTDESAVDLRYYDGSEYAGSYIGLSVTFDTTLLQP